MTDARLPPRWLMDRRFLRLAPPHFVSYFFALTYAVESLSDGVLTVEDLAVIPRYQPDSTAVLVQAGLLEAADASGNVFRIVDFTDTQSSAAQVRADTERRIKAREKKRNQRARSPSVPAAPHDAPPAPMPVSDWDTVNIPESEYADLI